MRHTAIVLLVLACMTNKFQNGDAPVIARAVFDGVANGTLNEQKPSTRLALFELIDFIYHEPHYNTAIVKQMTPRKFVRGLVSMAELEKDPKCLRVLFQLYEQIGVDWGDELDTESLQSIWESFMRYYPITLKDAPNKDPSVPTREELKEGLRRCLTSNGYYAKYAFHRLVELLETTADLSANNKVRPRTLSLNLKVLT
jgi:DNA repair/transcription protein MET18/MMS19